MIRRRQSRSTCRSSSRAAACCPAGAAVLRARRAAVSRRAGVITRSPQAVICTSARPAGARRGGDLLRGHGHRALQPEHPQLSQARHQLTRGDRPALDRDVGKAEHATGTQHPVALFEEGLPGTEMEGGLHADDPVHGRVGQWQPAASPATAAAPARLSGPGPPSAAIG